MVDMAHFAGLVAGKVFTGDSTRCRTPTSRPRRRTSRCAARAAGWCCASPSSPSRRPRLPDGARRPAAAHDGGQGGGAGRGPQPTFHDYAQARRQRRALAEGLLRRGAGLVTGGTDNHLVLLDVSAFGLTGRQAEAALLDAGIVTNRNSIPHDPNGAWYTSGVRLGTPALTTLDGRGRHGRVAELIATCWPATAPATAAGGAARPSTCWPTASARARPRQRVPSCWPLHLSTPRSTSAAAGHRPTRTRWATCSTRWPSCRHPRQAAGTGGGAGRTGRARRPSASCSPATSPPGHCRSETMDQAAPGLSERVAPGCAATPTGAGDADSGQDDVDARPDRRLGRGPAADRARRAADRPAAAPVTLDVAARPILYCHGTPRDDEEVPLFAESSTNGGVPGLRRAEPATDDRVRAHPRAVQPGSPTGS